MCLGRLKQHSFELLWMPTVHQVEKNKQTDEQENNMHWSSRGEESILECDNIQRPVYNYEMKPTNEL